MQKTTAEIDLENILKEFDFEVIESHLNKNSNKLVAYFELTHTSREDSIKETLFLQEIEKRYWDSLYTLKEFGFKDLFIEGYPLGNKPKVATEENTEIMKSNQLCIQYAESKTAPEHIKERSIREFFCDGSTQFQYGFAQREKEKGVSLWKVEDLETFNLTYLLTEEKEELIKKAKRYIYPEEKYNNLSETEKQELQNTYERLKELDSEIDNIHLKREEKAINNLNYTMQKNNIDRAVLFFGQLHSANIQQHLQQVGSYAVIRVKEANLFEEWFKKQRTHTV